MSHKRHMSAGLPPIADIARRVGTAEKCQEATCAPQQTTPLFDHLVSKREKGRRNLDAKAAGRRFNSLGTSLGLRPNIYGFECCGSFISGPRQPLGTGDRMSEVRRR